MDKKTPGATMDGYSRSSKFTETFFHYPTRNQHSQTQYEFRMGQQPIRAIQTKKKSDFHSLAYESALNPFAHTKSHHEPVAPVTGDRKRTVAPMSAKSSDPITLCYEPRQARGKVKEPFKASKTYRMEIERRHYLPVTRQLCQTVRQYHPQVGFSPSSRNSVTPRLHLNQSLQMRSTIQCQSQSAMRLQTCFDDFKYNSRK